MRPIFQFVLTIQNIAKYIKGSWLRLGALFERVVYRGWGSSGRQTGRMGSEQRRLEASEPEKVAHATDSLIYVERPHA